MESAIHILYVDDEPINLMLFRSMFSKKYSVDTAESGYQGLEFLKNNRDIKVIISDMRMPGMNGIEFIQKARELYPSGVFFILTGYDITPEIRKALGNGLISRYFQKPFNMKEIDEAISGKLGTA